MNKIEDSKEPVLKSARRARTIVKITCAVVGIIVGYLQLRNLPFVQIVDNMSAELIMKSALILYYFSWLFGATNDANDQELVLYNPKEITPNFVMGLLIFFLAGCFVFLCFAGSFRVKVVLLIAVIIIDKISHYYYKKKFVSKAFKFSEDEYIKGNKFVLYMKLDAVKKYLFGKWNDIRFGLGMVFLLLLLVFIYSPLNKIAESQLNLFSIDVVFSLCFLIFVLVYEGITWIKRFEIKVIFKTVEDILGIHQKMLSVNEE